MKLAAVSSLLLFAAVTHFLVDAVAGTLNPLWPRLDSHYHLTAWQNGLLFFIWQMTTSVSQFFFGIYGDRFHLRWLLWAGPLAAIVCLGSIGLTQSPWVLAMLLTISGLGIAAYHPEAAALAGSCSPERRSRAMSVFSMGGFLGQAVGPVFSGSMVEWRGLPALAWGIGFGLLAAAIIAPLGRGALRNQTKTASAPIRFRQLYHGRVPQLLLLLVIGSLRIIAAGGVPVLLGYLLKTRGIGAAQTGFVQSAFMLGIGLGGFACATLLRPHHERPILWLCPLLATPVLLVVPWTGGWMLMGATCLTGFLLGVSLPVLISYGQQLMPDSQRVASSITMGVSWGVGGGIVSIILAVCQYAGHFEPAFIVMAIATAVSSLLCIWLPQISSHERPLKSPIVAIATPVKSQL